MEVEGQRGGRGGTRYGGAAEGGPARLSRGGGGRERAGCGAGGGTPRPRPSAFSGGSAAKGGEASAGLHRAEAGEAGEADGGRGGQERESPPAGKLLASGRLPAWAAGAGRMEGRALSLACGSAGLRLGVLWVPKTACLPEGRRLEEEGGKGSL